MARARRTEALETTIIRRKPRKRFEGQTPIHPDPFVETFLYNVHVANGDPILDRTEYAELGFLCLILLGLMIVNFILPQSTFKAALERFRQKLHETRKSIQKNIVYALMAIPILFLVFFFGGKEAIDFLAWSGVLTTALLPIVGLVFIGLLIWLIARLLHLIGEQLPDLKGAMNEWGFSIKISMVFYLLLVASTMRTLTLEGIEPGMRLAYGLAIGKDFFLLFIIADMLFVGLYKIAGSKSLKTLFQTDRGFLRFMLVCAIIAVLAIWADFNGMHSANQAHTFRFEWQKQYNAVHVYVRDIGLLLTPIAGLLFWSLRRLANEPKESEEQP